MRSCANSVNRAPRSDPVLFLDCGKQNSCAKKFYLFLLFAFLLDLELLVEEKLAMKMCRPRMQGEVQRELWTELVLTTAIIGHSQINPFFVCLHFRTST